MQMNTSAVTLGRPKIPAGVEREVLTEAGHRCAVCGDPCPLERAHIVPWCKTKDHSVGNLVCLCANCHQRADFEKWGEKTLRRYKENPWVTRKATEKGHSIKRESIKLVINMNFDNFNPNQERMLRFAIAKFLEIEPDEVNVIKVERGSVEVTIKLPTSLARWLQRSFVEDDDKFSSDLREFDVQSVSLLEIHPPGRAVPLGPETIRRPERLAAAIRHPDISEEESKVNMKKVS